MDMFSRLKSAVSHVIPGNPLSRDFDIYGQIASAGPGLMWKVFSAAKKSTKEEASVFLFEKKLLEKHAKRDREAIIDALRRGVQQLTKLRHPRILSVIHPLEETREALAFAAEPVFSSLANVLGARDNMAAGTTKYLEDFTLFEVEIKHGLLQILEGLGFLHNDAKMIHRNVAPSSVILAKNGTWKVSGCEFVQQAVDVTDQSPTYSCQEWSSSTPPEAQPILDFLAPEYELTRRCGPASDMFSFGVLIYALYNKGQPVYECHNQLQTFRNKLEELSSVRGSSLPSVPTELTEHLKLLLNTEPTLRPDAAQMTKIPFFEDMACIALQYVDTLYQRENIEKSNFFKGLPKVIEHFPKRVSQQRILPALFKEGHNANMVPFVLPSIFVISEQSTQDEYRALILPDLIPFFKLREPIQVTLMFLQNMNLLLSKTPTQQIQTYVFPLIFSALEADNSQIQELCLGIIPTFADLIEYSTLKKSLVPRIKKLCLATSVLKVRVNCLLCLGKLMDQMDKWFVLDEILPFLREIPSREPGVLMSILGIHKVALSEAKLGITKDVMAGKVLPFLIPLSIDNNLNLHQFNAYSSVIREMLSKVETEHRTKLEQLDQIQQEHKTLEIGKITGENGVEDEKQNSFMDKFLSGVGLGSFLQTSSSKGAHQPPSSSAAATKVPSPGTTSPATKAKSATEEGFAPAQKTLSLEEKQRLAKQQDQERILRSQKNLVPRPLSSHSPSPSSQAMASGGGISAGGGASSQGPSGSGLTHAGPRDLTASLMASNMQQISLTSKAGSVTSLPEGGVMGSAGGMAGSNTYGPQGLSGVSSSSKPMGMGYNSSMAGVGNNWASSPASGSSLSLQFNTAQSSLNSSTSSIASAGRVSQNTSSLDSLFGPGGGAGGGGGSMMLAGGSKPGGMMAGGDSSGLGMGVSPLKPAPATPMNMMMGGGVGGGMNSQPMGNMMPSSWGGGTGMMGSSGMNGTGMGTNSWGGARQSGPVIGPRAPMMMPLQGFQQQQQPPAPKPLSNDDLKDLLG